MRTKRIVAKTKLAAAATAALTGAVLLGPLPSAHAATAPVSGSTAWGPCSWYTSNNVRYTSTANKQVRVKLSDTGKLGVKMRTKNENTGGTSSARYYPPLDKWQNMGKYSKKNTAFRVQFTCVNERKGSERPTTDFSGSLDY
ncbi:hypothetical protein QNO07_14825 [Streptomyces sp. 549]|uniref:hypothetical protein n=1 Tax=Streptomyces sp. 549 TaxID=3049076 RepID=UPI0024C3ABD8|nr:hypothetical protein [Streptomyces sp. 549]MDK1474679.1 hypothetical protein [Streptomyces sp. 549]